MEQVLEHALDRWVGAGLVEHEQAGEIRAFEQAAVPAPPEAEVPAPPEAGVPATPEVAAPLVPPPTADDGARRSWLAEGLAYVGAAFALGAGTTIVAQVWDGLGPTARVLVTLAATLVVAGGARALWGSTTGAGHRLATLLAAIATAGAAATTGLALSGWTGVSEELVALGVGLGGLVPGGLVHRVRASWPTTLVLGASVVTTVLGLLVVVGGDLGEVPTGLSLAAIGLAWSALGWAGWLRPRNAVEITGLLAGGIGCQVLAFGDTALLGVLLGIVVSGAVVAIGVTEERTSTSVLGGAGLTLFMPQLVLELLPDQVGGPLALLVAGVGLVVVAVLVLRRDEAVSS
jgi:hypothetical protein